MHKISRLAEETEFRDSLKRNINVGERRQVYRADKPRNKATLDRDNPFLSIQYYYQIRSNITHRGKAVGNDCNKIRSSLRELLPIFKDVIKAAQAEA